MKPQKPRMAKRMVPKRRVMKKKPSPTRKAMKKPESVEELDDHAAATMGDTPIP